MISRAGSSPPRNTMRPGVSLAGFAAAAKTTNVAGRAVEPGSQAERPGLASGLLPVQGSDMARHRVGAPPAEARRPGPRVRAAPVDVGRAGRPRPWRRRDDRPPVSGSAVEVHPLRPGLRDAPEPLGRLLAWRMVALRGRGLHRATRSDSRASTLPVRAGRSRHGPPAAMLRPARSFAAGLPGLPVQLGVAAD